MIFILRLGEQKHTMVTGYENLEYYAAAEQREDTTRKRLLFTYSNGEYILYFYKRNTLVRYVIDSLENGNWSKTIVDISGADKDATLLHAGGKFYYFINYNAYASNDGINFERHDFAF